MDVFGDFDNLSAAEPLNAFVAKQLGGWRDVFFGLPDFIDTSDLSPTPSCPLCAGSDVQRRLAERPPCAKTGNAKICCIRRYPATADEQSFNSAAPIGRDMDAR